MRILLAFILCGLWIASGGLSPLLARTWYIKPDGTGDAATIQSGVTAATNGDTVLLAPGTFSGAGNRDISLQGKAITVTSQAGPDETIIDCQGLGRAFDVRGGVGSSTVISKVTIQNGCSSIGGAILCLGSGPRIENNIIRNCVATGYGGGAIMCDYSYATIQNNYVTGCTVAAGAGGGIALYHCYSGLSLAYNTITNNVSGQSGGGVLCFESSPDIVNNTLVGNSAPLGGGIFFTGPGVATVSCTVVAFGVQGEGIACSAGASPWIGYCDLFGNAGGDAICGQDGGLNFSADPEFCGPFGTGEFWLWTTSPCAPENNPLGWIVGAWPVGCDATGIDGEDSNSPQLTQMPCYPNPFYPNTHIPFSLDMDTHVEMAIYDVEGRHVRTLIDGPIAAGVHVEEWDGRDDCGREVVGGVYFCRLAAGRRTAISKIVRLR